MTKKSDLQRSSPFLLGCLLYACAATQSVTMTADNSAAPSAATTTTEQFAAGVVAKAPEQLSAGAFEKELEAGEKTTYQLPTTTGSFYIVEVQTEDAAFDSAFAAVYDMFEFEDHVFVVVEGNGYPFPFTFSAGEDDTGAFRLAVFEDKEPLLQRFKTKGPVTVSEEYAKGEVVVVFLHVSGNPVEFYVLDEDGERSAYADSLDGKGRNYFANFSLDQDGKMRYVIDLSGPAEVRLVAARRKQ